jgi:deoxyribodipyrimidine photo-lyase
MDGIAIHWFRNDLRLADNRGLRAAARSRALVVVFVFDPALLRASRDSGPRVRFLLDCLAQLRAELERRGSRLIVRLGDPVRELPRLARELGAARVGWNRDVSPYARARDVRVRRVLERDGVRVEEHKDRGVFEPGEVAKADGSAYSVYGPYRRAWLRRLASDPQEPARAPRLPPMPRGVESDALELPAKLAPRADPARIPPGGERAALRRMRAFLGGPVRDYAKGRDLPARDGTSRLSPYLRFGAISIRTCLAAARELAAEEPRAAAGARRWIDELIWRDFYAQILWEHPRVLHASFRPKYDALVWDGEQRWLEAWRSGRTGFPIVDAGMRQLAQTGWMHNRARMIAASFLVKDLAIDWRRGERHFFERLVDGDPASNNGGWQWCAGTGTDAQPFFRIFNPTSQGERFDPDGDYVRRWVPELRALRGRAVHRPWEDPDAVPDYPGPIVDHAQRRELALERFRELRARGAR